MWVFRKWRWFHLFWKLYFGLQWNYLLFLLGHKFAIWEAFKGHLFLNPWTPFEVVEGPSSGAYIGFMALCTIRHCVLLGTKGCVSKYTWRMSTSVSALIVRLLIPCARDFPRWMHEDCSFHIASLEACFFMELTLGKMHIMVTFLWFWMI